MPLSLTSIIKTMINDGRDLNSLAKGNGQLEWETNVSLDLSKSRVDIQSDKKIFTYVAKVDSNHLLYPTFYEGEEEKTTDGVESFTTVLQFVVKNNKKKKQKEPTKKKEPEENKEDSETNNEAEKNDEEIDSNVRSETGSSIDIEYPDASTAACYVFCNCPHFKYYYKHADGKILVPQSTLSMLGVQTWDQINPRKNIKRTRGKSRKARKNPENDLGICKHIVATILYLMQATDTEQNFGNDPESNLLTDMNGELSKLLNQYNNTFLGNNIPLYASSDDEDREEYQRLHHLKITTDAYQRASNDLLRARSVKTELEKSNETLKKQFKTLRDGLKNKEPVKIKGKTLSKDVEDKKVLQTLRNKITSNNNLIDNYKKTIIPQLEKDVYRFNNRVKRQKISNFQKAYHWYENEKNRPPETPRTAPSTGKIEDVRNYLYKLNRDLKWYKHFKDKENIKRVNREIKKWEKKIDTIAAQKKLEAQRNKQENIKKQSRGQAKRELKAITNNVKSLEKKIDEAKKKSKEMLKNTLDAVIKDKPYNKKKINIESFRKDLDVRMKGLKKLKDDFINTVTNKDLTKAGDKDRDRKKEFLDKLSKQTDEKIKKANIDFAYIGDVIKKLNKVIEEGKDSLNDPIIKDYVTRLLKQKVPDNKEKKSVEKKVKKLPKEVEKKELLKKIKASKDEKSSEDKEKVVKANVFNKLRAEYASKIKRMVDNMADDLGIQFGSERLNYLKKDSYINKTASALAKAASTSKESLDLKKAIKNNNMYRSNIVSAIASQTGRSREAVQQFVAKGLDHYLKLI